MVKLFWIPNEQVKSKPSQIGPFLPNDGESLEIMQIAQIKATKKVAVEFNRSLKYWKMALPICLDKMSLFTSFIKLSMNVCWQPKALIVEVPEIDSVNKLTIGDLSNFSILDVSRMVILTWP